MTSSAYRQLEGGTVVRQERAEPATKGEPIPQYIHRVWVALWSLPVQASVALHIERLSWDEAYSHDLPEG